MILANRFNSCLASKFFSYLEAVATLSCAQESQAEDPTQNIGVSPLQHLPE